MEKLTISFMAIMHGDSEVLTESETVEAETRDELLPKVVKLLEEMTDAFRSQMGQES